MENENIASKAPILEKISMLKDTVVSGINSSSEASQKIVEEKSIYKEKVTESYAPIYESLIKQFSEAESEEERREIRANMLEFKKLERSESKDYDEFAGNTQAENNDHILKCAFIVAVGAGLIKFRKPLMNAGKLFMQRL